MLATTHVITVSQCLTALLLAGLIADRAHGQDGPVPERWFKGNTHCHTWWSDGDSPPEYVARWYKEHGYNFLVLSDHNVLSQGSKWVKSEGNREGALSAYRDTFHASWIETREESGATFYRCKPLGELRTLFEKPGEFLLIQGEEISDSCNGKPIHLNGINLVEVIPPQKGETVRETLQNNVDAVVAQSEATKQLMLVHVNHPNFGWALTAEDIAPLRNEQFFEVFNGHRGVANYGDDQHLSTERMWDIILTERLDRLNLPVMYGVATDDAHNFIPGGNQTSRPGRGWVMVRARYLTPEHIIRGLEKGDFYASTGVTLKDFGFESNTLTIDIDARPGVTYRTQFIGTMKDYDRTVSSRTADPDAELARAYSRDMGRILDEQVGPRAEYRLTGHELYVRAKVISDAPHPGPFAEGDVEVAWVQPVQPVKALANRSGD